MITKPVLRLLICLSIFLAINAHAECPWPGGDAQSGDFCYTVNAYDKAKITAYSGPGGNVVIPDTIDGYPVGSIGPWVFLKNTSVASVTIPDSVTTIYFRAFEECTNLTSVTFGTGLRLIDDESFKNCTSLTSITIPDSVWEIDMGAFSGCTALTSVTLGNNLIDIGSMAFLNCSGLTNISIPGSVTNIGSRVFKGCTGLTSLTIPDGITYIGEELVRGCTALTEVIIPDSVALIAHYAFAECSSLSDITIPGTVTEIMEGAFSSCTALTNINIPENITSIENETFRDCSSLTGVTIPDSVTTIGYEAFAGCGGLTSATLGSSVDTIRGGAFAECGSLTSISVDTNNMNYSSYEGVVYNKGKTTLVIYPSGRIGAFTIPESVISIEDVAFATNGSLTDVIIPDSVTSIGDYAFYRCTGLTTMAIPSSVTSIGEEAFYECSALSTVYFLGDAPETGDYAFVDTAPDFTVCFTSGATGFTTPVWEPVQYGGSYPAADCACLYDTDCLENETCENGVCEEIPDICVIMIARDDYYCSHAGCSCNVRVYPTLETSRTQQAASELIGGDPVDLIWDGTCYANGEADPSTPYILHDEVCMDGRFSQDCGYATPTIYLCRCDESWDVYCGLDPDRDGLPDSADNCPDADNPEQDDADLDGIGDACEVDAAPALDNGPFLATGYWPILTTDPDNPIILDHNYDVLWTFSDDYASCSELCTHTAEYKALGDTEWTSLSVSVDGTGKWYAYTNLPIDMLAGGTYALRFTITDCTGQSTQSGEYYFMVDNAPVIESGPFLQAGSWPQLPSRKSRANTMVLNKNYEVLWTFSDDYASCSEVCTHRARYAMGDSTVWTSLPVSADPTGQWYAYTTLPVESLDPGVYKFYFDITDCAGQRGYAPKVYYFTVE